MEVISISPTARRTGEAVSGLCDWDCTFADSLHRADLGAIFHNMNAEVYLHWRLLVADGTNGVVDLLITALIRVPMVGCAGIHISREAARGSELDGKRQERCCGGCKARSRS
jgi:hypothetical protein